MNDVAAYAIAGDGAETVIFLHGLAGDRTVWRPQLDALAATGRYRAVAWDMPGFGDAPAAAEMTFPGLAAALLRLVDSLGCAAVHLVGHSMGAMVAQTFVAAHPARVASLVLYATSPAFGPLDGEWQRQYLHRLLGPLDAGRSMAAMAPELVAYLVGDDADPAGVQILTETMARTSAEVFRQAVKCITGFDARATVAQIRSPTLLIAGETDRAVPEPVMARLAGKIEGARFHRIAGVGHVAHLERPEAFNAMLLEFLEALGRPEAAGG